MLLIPCDINPPPSSLDKDVLIKAWVVQTSNLGACNEQLQGIREWNERMSSVEK